MAQNMSIKIFLDNELDSNNQLSDIKIRVGPDKANSWVFPAHQLMLRASSPVFSAMLSGSFVESKLEEITIKDIPPYIFYKLLLFIYKGELQVQGLSEAFSVYLAADKYQIDNLKSASADELAKCPINWDAFWDFLPDFFGSHIPYQLKLKLMVFLDQNAKTVFSDNKFLFLSRELVTMIVSRNTLKGVCELVLGEKLVSWAKMQCFKNDVEPTAENKRIILGDAFYKMKLIHINKMDLITSPVYQLLTEQEKSDLRQRNTNSPFLSTLSTLPRDQNDLIQRGNKINSISQGPVYFVFSKDAFVRQMNIKFDSVIKQVVLSVFHERGRETLVSFGKYCNGEVTSFYVKAFTCYKLSFALEPHPSLPLDSSYSCLLSGSLGYEKGGDNAVFFSVNEEFVKEHYQFVAASYWKKAFSTQVFQVDQCASCLCNVHATFC